MKSDMPLIMQLRGNGKITSKHKCKKCGLPFVDTGKDLECANGHGTQYYDLRIWWNKKDIWLRYDRRGNRLRDYVSATRTLIEINHHIQQRTFDPGDYDKEKITSLRFDSAIQKWWKDNQHNYSPKSQKDYRLKIKLLIEVFKDNDVRDITAKDIKEFQSSLKDRGKKTINNIMGVLKAFYNDLLALEEIKRIPNFKPYMWITNSGHGVMRIFLLIF